MKYLNNMLTTPNNDVKDLVILQKNKFKEFFIKGKK